MNSSFVADASAAISWVIPSQSSPATEKLLDQVMAGSGIAVPSLWPYEVANTLLGLLRRKKMVKEDYLAARAFFGGLRASIDDESVHFNTNRTSDLALEYGLSVYDAAYLELAIRKQLSLASRDNQLNSAATRCGIRLLL